MGYKIVDEDLIANFQSRIDDCEEELEKYEHDFAVLKDQQAVALKMYSIADNNIDLISILSSSIKYMESVAERDEITGLEEVFDFDELKISSGLNSEIILFKSFIEPLIDNSISPSFIK